MNILTCNDIAKNYNTSDGSQRLVLKLNQFSIAEGEIVALLGKSGSGKSTFVKILAGLIKPTTGEVLYHGCNKPSMVFQSFSLLPWLNVLENVELGLEALCSNKEVIRTKALKAIDLVGLDGFETAYPKELSGGMKQRVSVARALARDPELLIMDEPFSSLDVLTTENLLDDIIDLWLEKKLNTKAILCVNHDIEHSLMMANRIIVFASDPGRITSDIKVELPYPRDVNSIEFKNMLDKIYLSMTHSERYRLGITSISSKNLNIDSHPEFAYRLPDADVSEIIGLLEACQFYLDRGTINLPELAEKEHLDIDNLFPLLEALDLLRFVQIIDGYPKLTDDGHKFIEFDIDQKKEKFAAKILEHIPLFQHINKTINHEHNRIVHIDIFKQELQDYLSETETNKLLKTAIAWGRYAEIFAYDAEEQLFSLEDFN